jgi:hypothetical protein
MDIYGYYLGILREKIYKAKNLEPDRALQINNLTFYLKKKNIIS